MSAPIHDFDQSLVPRFERLLNQRGVPHRYLTDIMIALEQVVTGSTATLTEAERQFALDAGSAPDAFSSEAARENALYVAGSAAADARRGRDLVTTNEVAALLHMDAANVRRMLGRGDIAAAGQVDRQTAYPRWQFTADARVLPGLRDVLAAFPEDFHPLDVQEVVTTPVDELNGRSPKEWLETGGSVAPVVALIGSLAYT